MESEEKTYWTAGAYANPLIHRMLDDAWQCHELGEVDKAELAYRAILNRFPNQPDALQLLGQLAFEAHHFSDAAAYFQHSLKMDPFQARAWYNFSDALRRVHKPAEAEAALRKCLALDPNMIMAYQRLGYLLLSLGRKQEAFVTLRRGLEVNPHQTALYRLIAFGGGLDPDGEDVKKIFALMHGGDLDDDAVMELHFALAFTYERAGKIEAFAEHITKANQLRLARSPQTLDDHRERIAKIKALFQRWRPPLLSIQHTGPTPIFVLGTPRCGSTMTEQILASHKNVTGIGEVSYLYTVTVNAAERMTGKIFPDGLEKLNESHFYELGKLYLNFAKQIEFRTDFFVDKFLLNFELIGFIKAILPHARIVHVRRNPYDSCFSIYKNFFNAPHSFYSDPKQLGDFYRVYDDIVLFWQKYCDDTMITVSYEDLVGDLEGQTRRILNYCGLPWDQDCLLFYKHERLVWTNSLDQVRQKPYKKSIGAWRKYEQALAPFFSALGKLPEGT